MVEHTPTPWELRGAATLRGANGDYVATLENNGRRAANAAFIIRACNSFDELVAALDGLSKAIGATRPDTSQPGWSLVLANLLEAKSVIAKARGETP